MRSKKHLKMWVEEYIADTNIRQDLRQTPEATTIH